MTRKLIFCYSLNPTHVLSGVPFPPHHLEVRLHTLECCKDVSVDEKKSLVGTSQFEFGNCHCDSHPCKNFSLPLL